MRFSRASSQMPVSSKDADNAMPQGRHGAASEVLRLRTLLKLSQDNTAKLAVLLREADHRIKNSLQIAASVMHAEARRSNNDELRDALITSASRIQAVSVIHDALQSTSGESLVDIADIMALMCDSMQYLCDGKAELKLDIAGVSFIAPVTFARPLLLIVNEIIVNALRHAFPKGRLGTVAVSINLSDDDIIVVIKDDGIGLSDSDSGHTGFGTDLIRMMTRQIDGTLASNGKSGTCFILTAPLPFTTDDAQAARAQPAMPDLFSPQNDQG